MNAKPQIRESDILAAVLAVAEPQPDDLGVSVSEYAAAAGCTKAQARLRMEAQVAEGKLLSGWAVKHDGANGQRRRVRVYRPA